MPSYADVPSEKRLMIIQDSCSSLPRASHLAWHRLSPSTTSTQYACQASGRNWEMPGDMVLFQCRCNPLYIFCSTNLDNTISFALVYKLKEVRCGHSLAGSPSIHTGSEGISTEGWKTLWDGSKGSLFCNAIWVICDSEAKESGCTPACENKSAVKFSGTALHMALPPIPAAVPGAGYTGRLFVDCFKVPLITLNDLHAGKVKDV